MRILRAAAWLTFPLMFGALWIASTGGFGGHPEIPVVFAMTSAILALIPESRRAGLIAMLLWIVLASGVYEYQKYIGPLGFAAFGTLAIAATAANSVRWSQWLTYPLAAVEAMWIASLAHQNLFEIATVGHPTLAVDGCMTALMPFVFGFFLTMFSIVSGFLTKMLPELRNATLYGTQPRNPLDARTGRIWLAVGVVAGATFGSLVWGDWQINNPCL